MSNPTSTRSAIADWWLIAAFALCICAPVVVQATGISGEDVITSRERRVPVPTPSVPRDLASWADFPRQTEDWYAERFGLRNELLYAHHWLKLQVYNQSPIENTVIGRDNWLFTNGSSARENGVGSLEYESGAHPLTDDELAAWRDSLVAKRDWLASRGIDYAFVLVPGKASIYPEMLPNRFAAVGPSRRDQFLEALSEASDVNVIDLLPTLLAERENDEPDNHLFFPLGMHWTARGAAVSSVAIMKALPERHRKHPIEELSEMRRGPSTGGDDLSFQFLVRDRFEQTESHFSNRSKRTSRRFRTGHPRTDHDIPTWINKQEDLTNALFIRDSFGTMVLPFLAEHFTRVYDVSTVNFTPALVEKLQPDIVIELFVDHTLGFQTPQHIHDFDQAALAARFAQLPHTLLAPVADGEPIDLASLLDTRIGATPLGMRIASDGSGSVQLPFFEWRSDQQAIIALDISVPEPTYLSLYYPLDGVNAYREKQASDVPVERGRQTIYVELPPPFVSGRIALLPGRASGDYMIRNVEVRAASK